MIPSSETCPCGSGVNLPACCGLLLDGKAADTAEALMRSRYTAYVLGRADYVLATWHPDTRPQSVELQSMPEWSGLEIVQSEAGGVDDVEGTVEFSAYFRRRGQQGVLHETSRFRRHEGRWVYLDGDIHSSDPDRKAIARNAPCPCGSGRKYKRCCAQARR